VVVNGDVAVRGGLCDLVGACRLDCGDAPSGYEQGKVFRCETSRLSRLELRSDMHREPRASEPRASRATCIGATCIGATCIASHVHRGSTRSATLRSEAAAGVRSNAVEPACDVGVRLPFDQQAKHAEAGYGPAPIPAYRRAEAAPSCCPTCSDLVLSSPAPHSYLHRGRICKCAGPVPAGGGFMGVYGHWD
jgi:hypothetical protein